MITYFYRNIRDDQMVQLSKFRSGTWIHAEAPTNEEIELLTSKFNVDEDLLKDALDPDEIPRIEIEDENVYVYMRYATRSGDQVSTNPILIVIGPKFVATVSPTTLPILSGSKSSMQDVYTTQNIKLLLQLMHQMIATYESNITFLTRQIRGLRGRLNVATVNNRDFIRFVVIEDALNDFLSELIPTHLMLTSLLSSRYGLASFEEDHDMVEDLIQLTRQLTDTTRGAMRTIVNIREAYSNIMTNNLNRQIKLLTSLTVVLTIPTIMFSLYGMNVGLPGQHSPGAFAAIVLGTLAACAGVMYLLYRRRWL